MNQLIKVVEAGVFLPEQVIPMVKKEAFKNPVQVFDYSKAAKNRLLSM